MLSTAELIAAKFTNHYDSHLNTGLTAAEKADLVGYLKSL